MLKYIDPTITPPAVCWRTMSAFPLALAVLTHVACDAIRPNDDLEDSAVPHSGADRQLEWSPGTLPPAGDVVDPGRVPEGLTFLALPDRRGSLAGAYRRGAAVIFFQARTGPCKLAARSGSTSRD